MRTSRRQEAQRAAKAASGRCAAACAALLAAFASLITGGAARAQIQSSSSVTAGDSSCDANNNANGFCGFEVELLESTGDTFSSVYRWNINVDAPAFGNSRSDGSADHHVVLDIVGEDEAWYDLIVEQRWKWGYSFDDEGNLVVEVDSITGVNGQYSSTSFDLVSGDMDLDDPGNFSKSDESIDITETAVLRFQGTGSTRSYSFDFRWDGRVESVGEESAFRMGLDNGSTTNCTSCNYPGTPSRDQDEDGHFVTFTLEKLCGNGVIDTNVGEECDGGDCCDETSCTLENSLCNDGESCTNDFCALQGVAGVCGFANVANGTSCSDGLHCNGTDTCQTGECANHSGDPCAGNLGDGDGDCSESCDEATDSCTANDANNTVCDDGRFCTVTDLCLSGGCVGLGNPCPDTIGDSDDDCSESCDEATDSCTANDIAGVSCSDGLYCTGTETCDGNGSCAAHTGDPCAGNLGDADADCSESCDESSDSCIANDPGGSACTDGLFCTGTDSCDGSGSCATHAGDPCAGSLGDADADCSESCDESSDSCTANDPGGSACTDGLFCTGADSCDGSGSCATHAGDPCASNLGDSDDDCSESCDESADACTANDPTGSRCDDLYFCNGSDTCDAGGSCATHAGDPCAVNLGDGDSDCSESCSESARDCIGNDPAGSACDDGLFCTGSDSCDGSGACADHGGDPCTGPDGDTDCAESCRESDDSCAGPDPDGSTCRLGMDGVCDPSEVCTGGTCPADAKAASGTPCGDGDACDGEETCDGAGFCAEGTAPDCDDGDLCTQDSCDSAGGCMNLAEPVPSCFPFDEATLQIEERRPGYEKLIAKFKSGPVLEQLDLGNPLALGGTSYAVCLYDALDDLAGRLQVDRAGLTCSEARKACWRPMGDNPPDGRGYQYHDTEALSDGLLKLQLRGNGRSASSAIIRATNDANRGLLSMPTGIAAALEGHTRATMQLMSSDGVCLSADLTRSGRDVPGAFRGRVE